MDSFCRIVFCTLVLCHHTWSKADECNHKLGMKSKRIPNESITSSSQFKNHAPSDARLDGPKAWCSALEDKSPYIQILLDEEKSITAIETQGSVFDFSWSRKYDVSYLKEGKWTLYKEGLTGNKNSRSPHKNYMRPPIKTTSIRIYPKDPLVMGITMTTKVPCLRLELHGCSAPADCRDPGIPSHGRRIGNNFSHGSKITFECLPGFVLVGNSTSFCNKGRWSHIVPNCKATCEDPGVPNNGHRRGNTFIDGDSVEFTCDINYSLTGSSILRCLNGRWSSTVPTCKAESPPKSARSVSVTQASCPDPGVPENGQRVGSSFEHDKHVTFACNPGFWLVGSQIVVCKEGKWNNGIPKCKALCSDPGSPRDGIRIGDDFGDGQMVAYRCDPNFNLVGSPTSFCVAGQWNSSRPTCKASCSDPGVPQHGQRIGSNFGHGSKVTFVCLPQYSLGGSHSMTCHDGKWSSVLPVCKASCKDPGTPENGVRHGNEFGHNKRISFSCLPGFRLTGSSGAVCINGKWSTSLPRCKAVCPDPGVPVNGSRIGDNFIDNETVAFKCQPDYTLIGSQVLRCVAGKWNDDTPECKASCPDAVAPSNGRFLTSRPRNRHGERLRFACDSGFKLEGSSTIRCNNGKWNSPAPLCKDVDECAGGLSSCHVNAVCKNTVGSFTCKCNMGWFGDGRTCSKLCKDPGIPLNGARKGGNFGHGKRISFTCNDGYTLIGNRSITCWEGEWSSALPQCKKSCADPGAPQNGRRRGSDFRHGKTVTFLCQPRYRLSGISRITCNDGTWNDIVPVCTAICKDPVIPQHGERQGSNFESGNTVNFTCNAGYTLVGSRTIECRDGIWSSALPQCKNFCANPGHPRNGRKLGSDFRHGKTVRFLCLHGFSLSGVSSITCNDGTWNDKVPLCTAICKDPGTPQHGTRQGSNFESGNTVNFTCNARYTLVGSRTIECRDGIWSSALPQCKNFCANPGTPQNGRRVGSDFGHGKTVTFLCLHGFTLSGVSRITCNDGTWSEKVPVCTAICKDPGIPQHGARKGNSFEHGKTVSFSCNSGFTLVGSLAIKCRDGIWSSPSPQCKKTCIDPGAPRNGRRRGSDFRHNKSVEFLCQPGFKLKGISSITCSDGTWSDKVPVCRGKRSCKEESCRMSDKAVCKIPSNLKNGVILTDKFDNEGLIELSCNHGYKLIGSPALHCVSGQWNDSIPECREDACTSPPKIAHGLHDGNDYSSGRSVTYSCHAQYVLEGSAVITCLDGQWVGKAPVCRAPCPPPKVPTNGFVFGDNLHHQGSVQFWCDVGFVLRGSSSSHCDDGQWDSPTPRCEAFCKIPSNLKNGVILTDKFDNKGLIELSCNHGYKLIGSPALHCVNGQWNDSVPQCQSEGPPRGSCRKPPIPLNAHILPLQAQEQWFSHEARVYYRCNSGYSPVGFSIQRCKNGKWSRLAFSCIAKSCGHPGVLVFGKISSYVFTYNSTVEYSCNQGYRLAGTTKRVCQANQTWTGSLPRCKRLGCGRLPTPANGEKVTETSTVVRFRCKGLRQYRLVGSSTRKCLESGQWSGQQPSCQVITCNDPGTPVNGARTLRGNGFFYLGSVQFTCNNNYKLQGVSRIYCLEGGYWSRPRPRCLPVTVPCSHPGTPKNGRLIGNDFSHKAIVQFKCKSRYRLVGAKKLTCNNGKWSGEKPRCEKKERGKP